MSASEKFIGEPIQPAAGTFDTGAMSKGEPGLPQRFSWRDREYAITQVLDKWKETSPCRSGAREQYVRKHWYKVRTADHLIMKVYFERNPLPRGKARTRWWLYSLVSKDKEVLP